METGRRGEEIAAEWLVKRGFRVLERNWRSGHKEVDLVVESERAVHIVEVKTLTPPVLTLPAEKVDARKQARLVAAARRLIAERHDCRMLVQVPDTVPNHWVAGILTDRTLELMREFREKGIYASGVHLQNNHYSVFKNHEVLPGVEEFHRRFLALPTGWWCDIK